jgi:hypothetical protein
MKIIRGRLKSFGSGPSEFISVEGRIKGLILKNPGDEFEFTVDDNGRKSIKKFGPENIDKDLVGKEVVILNGTTAKFNKDGTIEIVEGVKYIKESLPRQSTKNQLERVRKASKGTDIGDRISDMNDEGANVGYIHNAIDGHIESYEEFQRKNQSFTPNWNLKHLLSPFGGKVTKLKN